MSVRVKLGKSLSPLDLPVGTLGTVIGGDMARRGMLLVVWDNGMEIPMYRGELDHANTTAPGVAAPEAIS
jgi:hypothetical protein